jgi:hypothetical protein
MSHTATRQLVLHMEAPLHKNKNNTEKSELKVEIKLVKSDGLEALLGSEAVEEATGLRIETIDALEAAGLFPKRWRPPYQSRSGWLESEVFAFVEAARAIARPLK